ncbi:uncharacterized protein LOC113341855 [Papaver somniferum]|uniref:uncharacterized protein LOC113341855 n=1 Tax=Papaver somniferum TaxID=3469 RepID=UPI000E6FFAE3|nr:uncharacterized protein LOC113341855 [Papaver somniferum]
MWGSDIEDQILKFFQLHYSKMKKVRIIKIYFYLPNVDETILCCDGASRGNPGQAGYGFIVRFHTGEFVYAESGGLGILSNYIVEFIASISALEWALNNHKFKVILQTDSKACVVALKNNKIPLFLVARWQRVVSGLQSIIYRHVYREVNFSVDHFAKKGVYLPKGQIQTYNVRPTSLTHMEFPDQPYCRFE